MLLHHVVQGTAQTRSTARVYSPIIGILSNTNLLDLLPDLPPRLGLFGDLHMLRRVLFFSLLLFFHVIRRVLHAQRDGQYPEPVALDHVRRRALAIFDVDVDVDAEVFVIDRDTDPRWPEQMEGDELDAVGHLGKGRKSQLVHRRLFWQLGIDVHGVVLGGLSGRRFRGGLRVVSKRQGGWQSVTLRSAAQRVRRASRIDDSRLLGSRRAGRATVFYKQTSLAKLDLISEGCLFWLGPDGTQSFRPFAGFRNAMLQHPRASSIMIRAKNQPRAHDCGAELLTSHLPC